MSSILCTCNSQCIRSSDLLKDYFRIMRSFGWRGAMDRKNQLCFQTNQQDFRGTRSGKLPSAKTICHP